MTVLSRPMANENEHKPVWSSVYVDFGVGCILFSLKNSYPTSFFHFAPTSKVVSLPNEFGVLSRLVIMFWSFSL